MAETSNLVEERFDLAEAYADNAIDTANNYITSISSLLASLVIPDTDEIDDVALPTIDNIDYSALPSFSAVLEEFPSFITSSPLSPDMEDVPEVSADIPTKSFSFVSTTYSAPDISYPASPGDSPELASVTLPDAPTISFPDAPTIDDIVLPAKPDIDLGDFTATAPDLTRMSDPAQFQYTEASYNSDIRVALFNKILYDIANGGTGLEASVEGDIYDRGWERQRVENERLYQEIQNQFSASGFELPPGAYAARMAQVSNEIARKNDQLSREIVINQAELAQKNTTFTLEQAVILERMLADFFNNQQNRAVTASQALAASGVDVYKALVSQQTLSLEKYKTEAGVFETKIKAELGAMEIYKTEVEASMATLEVQKARVSVYNSQLGAIDILTKIYATQMESAKVKATIQSLAIDIFKAKTEAYVKSVEGEKAKVDLFSAQVESEKIRSEAFKNEVDAHGAEVQAKLAELEAKKATAEAVLQKNAQKIEQFKADLEKYRSDIDAEIKTAQLLVSGYEVESNTYTAQVRAKGVEFESRIAETKSQIDLARAKMEKARAIVQSTSEAYVALKKLQSDATQGVMNANTQLAASAMNAVNASADQSISSRTTTSESISTEIVHKYDHKVTSSNDESSSS